MKLYAATAVAVLALTSLSAQAGVSEVTPIGKGRYLIAGKGYTSFSTTDKMTTKAMKKANAFCATQGGKEAVMVSREAEDASYEQPNVPQTVVTNNVSVSATAIVNEGGTQSVGQYPVVKEWQPDYQAQNAAIQSSFAAMAGYRPASTEIIFVCEAPVAAEA
ncbi:hypothetical protein MNR01_14995 [Lysobacter sp. S4-A87]|uniref:hypothetical protein n=1 Tax=Lysobacter sp. S4-A87 TaxID=2925843 RepID=UPI001F52B915|nr:hypothetical protein [Lysobacter sp. S4-A87]UNK49025.1 hypothetical protein MNR01_14995 [Lysobacter sp. S4-A87]